MSPTRLLAANRGRVPALATSLVLIAFVLAGCAPMPGPQAPPPAAAMTEPPAPSTAQPAPTSTPAPSPTPAPTPTPALAGVAAAHLGWLWPEGSLAAQKSLVAPGDEGVLYVMDSESTVHGLSPAGRELWQYHGAYDEALGPWAAPGGDALYLVTDRNEIVVLGLDGKERWTRNLPEGASALWVAPDDALIVSTSNGGRRVTPDGKTEEAITLPEWVSDVVFDGAGHIYAPTFGEIWVASPDGKKERACKAKIIGARDPLEGLPGEGFLYSDNEGYLIAAGPDCTERWRYLGTKPERGWGSVVVAEDGGVFAYRGNGELHSLDQAGQARWVITPTLDVGYYLLPGPGGSVIAAGGAGDLAAFDSSGKQVWSQSPYYAGSPGRFVRSGANGFAVVQGGHLHYFTTDPALQAALPTAVPPAATVKQAEAEIVDFLLDQAGCRGDAVAVWGEPAAKQQGTVGVDTAAPKQVWWCEDGKWVEQADKRAAIEKARKLNEEAGYDVRQYPVAYHEFAIRSIAGSAQEAEVYVGETIGPLWGSGYVHTLRRMPSGEWNIVKSDMQWVS